MYCVNCGTQLPDGASFCLKCGKPQKVGVQALTEEEPKWETCEIDYYLMHRRVVHYAPYQKFKFNADAISTTDGRYNAGETCELRGDPSYHWGIPKENELRTKMSSALDQLVSQLTEDGWEPLPRGQYWYSYRFRRRIRSEIANHM